ncbi:MAG TPA: 7TM diverse intracellular signaling domain-containing protein [Oligoflexus sp.]|uniref:7TM diverse intracellular signaling domain-containing protein n=1 Tax=Oligoflexus sp. TaxID=1971216 RepID=UPI002D34407D|nr:7TM diverse intracellular signaling domain-containing protein [Oligoflexus sp.]HYX32854.1 7TM diverse intracellular signaling domain-containing protein [Oligoflexus sp.]
MLRIFYLITLSLCLLTAWPARASFDQANFSIGLNDGRVKQRIRSLYYRISDHSLSEAEIVSMIKDPSGFEFKEENDPIELVKGYFAVHAYFIENTSDQNVPLVFHEGEKTPRTYQLFQNGQLKKLEPQPSAVGVPYFVELTPGQNILVTQRILPYSVSGRSPLICSILVYDPQTALSVMGYESSIILFVFGSVSCLGFYSLIMFVFFRKAYFLSYFFYITSTALILMASYAVISLTIPVYYFILSISILSLFVFSSHVLSLKTVRPRLYRVSVFLAGTEAVTMLCGYLLGSMDFVYVVSTSALVFNIVCAASVAVKKDKSGYYLLMGWFFFLLGLVLTLLDMKVFGRVSMVLLYASLYGFFFEIFAFTFAISHKLRHAEKLANAQISHAFDQLAKVFYPHQIQKIKENFQLEETMPTHKGEACVICFDIIHSARIDEVHAKSFIRNLFKRCNEIMVSGYDGDDLRANAYRIKEMGDGFLCSVGYPFKSANNQIADDAVELAMEFFQAMETLQKSMRIPNRICAGIGLAMGTISGFYPEAGTKEYDLYGPAIILATRYEAMRKVLLTEHDEVNILIIQEGVFKKLNISLQREFTEFKLAGSNVVVRDDNLAEVLYYRVFDGEAQLLAS